MVDYEGAGFFASAAERGPPGVDRGYRDGVEWRSIERVVRSPRAHPWLLAGLTLWLVACASPRSSAIDMAVRTEPPNWFAEYASSADGLGEDVVALGDGTDSAPPQVRSIDGTWADLVPVPAGGNFIANSLGDTVVAWGAECSGDCADGGPLAVFLLADDRSEWRRLDVPRVIINSEVETVPYPSAGERFVLSVGREFIQIDRTGQVESLPGWPDGARTVCLTEAGLVALGSSGSAGLVAPVERVEVLDLEEVGAGWRPASAPPVGVTTDHQAQLCGPRSVLVLDAATDTEWRYLPLEDRWTSVPTNYRAAAQSTWYPSDWHGEVGWAPDGSTVVGSTPAGVLVRGDDGTWTPTDHQPGQIIATDAAVYVVNEASPDAQQVWPRP